MLLESTDLCTGPQTMLHGNVQGLVIDKTDDKHS